MRTAARKKKETHPDRPKGKKAPGGKTVTAVFRARQCSGCVVRHDQKRSKRAQRLQSQQQLRSLPHGRSLGVTCLGSPTWFKGYLPEHNVQRLVQIVFDPPFCVLYRPSSVALLSRPDPSAPPRRSPLSLSPPAP